MWEILLRNELCTFVLMLLPSNYDFEGLAFKKRLRREAENYRESVLGGNPGLESRSLRSAIQEACAVWADIRPNGMVENAPQNVEYIFRPNLQLGRM